MKKLLSLCAALLLCLSALPASSFAEDDFLVIYVNAAMQTMSVNSEPVDSPKLFVSSNGTTMVPFEVIAAAFGCETAYSDTGAVLTYAGVTMTFTLDSAHVTIDKYDFTMPEALTYADGVLTVPLRFMTESLGADCGYDAETGDIIITAEDITQSSSVDFRMLLKYGDKERIGHSGEKWSFATPSDFDMEEYWGRYFYAEDISFQMTASKNTENVTLEMIYATIQSMYSGMGYYYSSGVLYEKTMGTRAGLPYACIKLRNTWEMAETHVFLTDDYIYMFMATVPFKDLNDYRSIRTMDDILSSFRIDYDGTDENTVDINTASFKARGEEYKDECIRWEITPHGTWQVETYYGFTNTFFMSCETGIEEETQDSDYYDQYYYDDYPPSSHLNPSLQISVFTNPENQSIEAWAAEKIKKEKDSFNPEFLTVSELADCTIGEYPAKKFTASIDYEGDESVLEAYFLYDGSYRYMLELAYDPREAQSPEFLENTYKMLDTFVPTEAEIEEIGNLLTYDGYEKTDAILEQYENDYMSFKAPFLWNVSGYKTGSYISVYEAYGSTHLYISHDYLDDIDDDGNVLYKTLEQEASEGILSMRRANPRGTVVVKPLTGYTFKGRRAYTFTIGTQSDGKVTDTTEYIMYEGKDNDFFVITLPHQELYRNTRTDKIRQQIIDSIVLK